MKKPTVGIMSGRLSHVIGDRIQEFPENTWESEFDSAAKIGFSSIEWIFDQKINPIFNSKGRNKMQSLSKEFSVDIKSIICDYFMEKKLFGVPEKDLENNFKKLEDIIYFCGEVGINIIEIPLVDSSSIKTKQNEDEFRDNFCKILELSEKENVKIALETDFPPEKFKAFLDSFGKNKIFANYDTGNSSSLGYDINEEMRVLKDKIIHIHVKDRILNDGTVPLGIGDTKFELFFKNIAENNFSGEIIIQGARQDHLKTPFETCKEYLLFVNNFLEKYY